MPKRKKKHKLMIWFIKNKKEQETTVEAQFETQICLRMHNIVFRDTNLPLEASTSLRDMNSSLEIQKGLLRH